ncbi:MAG: hypothetical protein ACE5FO_06250 [Parvularculaceae bacterium]
MIRITMIFLCLLLAAAAAGRYKAEVSVRETHEEIRRLQQEKVQELRKIQTLRAELAYLESPERLAKIAEKKTDLKPLTGAQLLSGRQFAAAFGDPDAVPESGDPNLDDAIILHALAMADLARIE